MLNIVDQTPDFIVIHKPENISFHNENQKSGIHSQLKNQLNVKELYPVHRLDKMTSGLLVFALNKASAQIFQKLFEQKTIEKYYLAISNGKPKKKQGLIKGDITKSRRGMYKLLRTRENPAISQFFSTSIGNNKRLYLVKPHTGKTHQIRVSLNSIGSPILGDDYYSKSRSDRGYLHAFGLRFNYNGKHYNYLAQPNSGIDFLSDSCQQKIQLWMVPWQLNWPKILK